MLLIQLSEVAASLGIGMIAGVLCATTPLSRLRGADGAVAPMIVTLLIAMGIIAGYAYFTLPADYWKKPARDEGLIIAALIAGLITVIGSPAAYATKAIIQCAVRRHRTNKMAAQQASSSNGG
jgi:glycerol uptake facilitator-like aquaporin